MKKPTPGQTIKDNLLAICDAYAKATGLKEATISRKFHGHRKFFEGLRSGNTSMNLDKLDTMLAKFAWGWPGDTPWPVTTDADMGFKAARSAGPPPDYKAGEKFPYAGAPNGRIEHKPRNEPRRQPATGR